MAFNSLAVILKFIIHSLIPTGKCDTYQYRENKKEECQIWLVVPVPQEFGDLPCQFPRFIRVGPALVGVVLRADTENIGTAIPVDKKYFAAGSIHSAIFTCNENTRRHLRNSIFVPIIPAKQANHFVAGSAINQ